MTVKKTTQYEIEFAVASVHSWYYNQDKKVQAHFNCIFEFFEEFGGSSNSDKIPRSKLKKVRGAIWEIRIEYNTNIYRVFYSWDGNKCFLLHGFQKKSDAIPKQDLETALKRLKSCKHENVRHKPKKTQSKKRSKSITS
jgi:phage-related protein